MSQKTNIDWFAFRSKDTPDVFCTALQPAFEDHHALSITPRKTGWRSFERAYDVWLTDMRANDPDACLKVGMMMSGGDAVRGWSMASFSGDGCSWVKDWGKAMDACTEGLADFELKRVDVALDRYDGSHWHEVDEAWKAGEFSPAGGGKAPKAKPIDSRRPEDGRTYYVGSREGAKFYRGYEKGMQLLGPQIALAQAKDPEGFDLVKHLFKNELRIDRTDGDARVVAYNLRDWWRDEVEFKPVNQPLPLDIIDKRDQYFAGAYPYLGKVLPTVEAEALVQRREKMPQLELAKALQHIRKQFGSTLYTALHAYQGDIGEVWGKVVGEAHNRALVDAGVLLVEHD